MRPPYKGTLTTGVRPPYMNNTSSKVPYYRSEKLQFRHMTWASTKLCHVYESGLLRSAMTASVRTACYWAISIQVWPPNNSAMSTSEDSLKCNVCTSEFSLQ